ncbi:leucine-rich repeat domain-containing protein [Mycoplasma flocculare]|uniref:leucine-rich repeat domain-containing protein n=1 Tax=Mesomycoplasma flocculare TaxID=2128 RepID=UPI0013684E78|nr:leucine-rich repeat domain-containing protein [Mesomycoplasma flocculare]MXR06030.1 leucine-rich repeat domain-containing protein [Mesomycoplasma flocculare]MXR12446.1 leucine-rich repeat domain-containing protein [Mesomycoplasma flocculare]MXR22849.1 leucine-rich repeat domain-containing protein [Mesomycoplasma flocculare]MXR56189.1 leucine-rich repeat domain-containing protein [Mesomycoplasma flocculare]
MQFLLLTRKIAIKIINNQEFFHNKILDLSFFNFQEIADFAFSGLNLDINKLILPDSLLKIGESAFMLNKIKKIIFGSNIETILDSAFEANLIRKIEFPKKVTQLNNSVFANNKIKNLVIPSWISKIGSDCFADNLIKTLEFKSNNINVDIYAFVGNSPNQVNILGKYKAKNGDEIFDFYKFVLDFLINFDKFDNSFKVLINNLSLNHILFSFNWENLQTINLICPENKGKKQFEIFIDKAKIGKNLEFEGLGSEFFKKTLKIY